MSKVIFIALSSVFFAYESIAMYVDDISETYGIHKRHLSSTDDTALTSAKVNYKHGKNIDHITSKDGKILINNAFDLKLLNLESHKRKNEIDYPEVNIEKDTDYQQKERLSYEQENFILGMKEFRSRNFKKSFDYLEKAALYNHADAEYTLGLFYEFALDQQRNFKEAEYWYSRSGTDGNEKAKESIKRVNEKKNSWFYNWY